MIILKVEEICQECPEFSPETRQLFGDDKCILTEVLCSNAGLCEHIQEFIKEKLNKKKGD